MLTEQELKTLLPDFESELVSEVSESGALKSFTDGDILLKTGQYIRSTIIVVDGLVKVFREDEEGDEYFMYYIEPGEACALSMMAANEQNTSELTIKAAGNVELISVPLDKMDEWMLKYKTWYHYVLRSYRARFQELLNTIDHIAFRNMDERLVFYLKKHQKTLKSNTIPYTHAEIASELNSSREVISRLMKKLADKGHVKLNRQSIEIIDLDNF